MSGSKETKKQKALAEIFHICLNRGDMVFDNKLAAKIGKKYGVANYFDITKVDSSSKLPSEMRDEDYFLLHLGGGKHMFVKGIRYGYHKFEPISEDEIFEWKYRKSILNEIDTSESNIISVGINQRIIHDFLYDDIVASPKIYGARRTKTSFKFYVGHTVVETENVQMEIDGVVEYLGDVTTIEGKNGGPIDFAVYQLYYPFRYYNKMKMDMNLPIKKINSLYLLRQVSGNSSTVSLYLYSFESIDDMGSIKLLKKARYRLIRR